MRLVKFSIFFVWATFSNFNKIRNEIVINYYDLLQKQNIMSILYPNICCKTPKWSVTAVNLHSLNLNMGNCCVNSIELHFVMA